MKWVKNWPIDDSIWDWPIHFHFLVGILVVWGVDLKLTHFTANWMLPKIGAWIWVEFLFEIGQFFSNFLFGLFGRFDWLTNSPLIFLVIWFEIAELVSNFTAVIKLIQLFPIFGFHFPSMLFWSWPIQFPILVAFLLTNLFLHFLVTPFQID